MEQNEMTSPTVTAVSDETLRMWVEVGNPDVRSMATELLRARSALADVGEWRPIESAPEDGTSVLIYCEGWRDGSEAHYIPDHGWYLANVDHTDNHGRAFCPSHWQPLPAALDTGKQPRPAAEVRKLTPGELAGVDKAFWASVTEVSPAAHTAQVTDRDAVDRLVDDLLVAYKFHSLEQPQRNNDGETMKRAALMLQRLASTAERS